jgi:hypothetical protein
MNILTIIESLSTKKKESSKNFFLNDFNNYKLKFPNL